MESAGDSAALTEALDQLLASKTFARSGQLKRLLLYFRDAASTTDPAAWSETAIGANAFGRKDFNPKLDTIVRVEMRRLRQKLDEYYSTEGIALPVRLRFERNTYKPYLEPHVPAPPEFRPPDPAPIPERSRFWTGFAAGAAALAVLAAAAALLLWTAGVTQNRAPREIAESPIWSGFRSTSVTVAIGTPLFFRSGEGFERIYRANVPDDLRVADEYLLHKPAFPLWSRWTTYDDLASAVALDRFLQTLNSTATFVPARQLSFGSLSGKRTIIIGQPRGAPLLIDLLADQNFRPPVHVTGETFAGVVNTDPKPGEASHYPIRQGNLLMETDESSPDYAVVTTVRLPAGGEVISLFGDRIQTGAYLARKLTEPAFVSELTGRVFDRAKPHQSAQAVFRVDYSRGTPTGLVYITHRFVGQAGRPVH